jgi:hypothetical protein
MQWATMRLLANTAFDLIPFERGCRLNLRRLRANPWRAGEKLLAARIHWTGWREGHGRFRNSDRMIPSDIREFILQRLNSIAELEALLLLWRNPDQDWDKVSLARRLYITEPLAGRVLLQLRAQNLVEENNGFYRYGRSSEALGVIVDRLAQLYTTHLIPITHLVHSKASSRIQEFADAFVLRKDK